MIANKIILLVACLVISGKVFGLESPKDSKVDEPVDLELNDFIDKVLKKAEADVIQDRENEKLLPIVNKVLDCSFSIAEAYHYHKEYMMISAKMVQEAIDNRRDFKQLGELRSVCKKAKIRIKKNLRNPIKKKKKLDVSAFPKGAYKQEVFDLYVDFLRGKKECTSVGADFVVGLMLSIGPFIGGTVCRSAFGQKQLSPSFGMVESSPDSSGPCLGMAAGFSRIKGNARSPTRNIDQFAIVGVDREDGKINRVNLGFLIGENRYHLCTVGKFKLGRDLKPVRQALGFDY